MTLFVLSLRHFLQQNKKNEDVIFAGEHWKFEIFVKDFDRKVQEIPANFNSIYDFWYFCSNLHDSIDWKSNMEILKFLLIFCPVCYLKKAFAGLCKKFQFDFSLLSVWAKMILFFRSKDWKKNACKSPYEPLLCRKISSRKSRLRQKFFPFSLHVCSCKQRLFIAPRADHMELRCTCPDIGKKWNL